MFAALLVLPGCSLLPWDESYGPYVLNNTDQPIHVSRTCSPGHATQRTGESTCVEFDVAPYELAYGSTSSYNHVESWTITVAGQDTTLNELMLKKLADRVHVAYDDVVIRVDPDGIHPCKLDDANKIVQSAAMGKPASGNAAK